MLKQKCIGCGVIYGEKGTDNNGGITGGVCQNCNIRRMEITRDYLQSMIDAFPSDPNHKKWIKRLELLKKELTIQLIQRQEDTKCI